MCSFCCFFLLDLLTWLLHLRFFFLLLFTASLSSSHFIPFFEVLLFSPLSRDDIYNFACVYIEVSPLWSYLYLNELIRFCCIVLGLCGKVLGTGGCRGGFCEKAPGVVLMLDCFRQIQDELLHFPSHVKVFRTGSRPLRSTRWILRIYTL